MTNTAHAIRVLIVDDNRDGADALGLLVEALGHLTHVTYGGKPALEVATAFQPDLMLVDLLMPGLDGCGLVKQIRQMSAFSHIQIVAVTGQKENEHKALAMRAGFDAFLIKPASLAEIRAVLESVETQPKPPGRLAASNAQRFHLHTEPRLPVSEARRLRSDRPSKALTETECEAAVCDGIIRFQEEYLGWRSERVHVHFIKDLLLIRIRGVLTQAEQQLSRTLPANRGRDMIKQTRKQLLELARPMLESLVHEAVGVKVRSMHHDISTVTAEEMVVFSLVESPRFQECPASVRREPDG